MRSDRGPRRLPAHAGRPWLRLAPAALLAALFATAAAAQLLDDRAMPSGSPLAPGAQAAQPGAQQAQQSQQPLIDPGAATLNQRIDPVQIEGSDRSTLLGTSEDARNLPRVKPPAPPNEFERYVAAAIGRALPRFGASLLLPSNRDYAVPATATVPPDYVLNVGDVVAISLVGSTEGSVDKEIDPDGRIFLPRIGAVHLAGIRYADLRDTVMRAIGTQYRGYDVTVGIRRLRGIRVYVTGFANDPGAYTVNSLSTMVNAVLAAGGPSSGGSFRSVRLYRHGRLVSDFDLYDLVLRGDRSRDAVLQNEDTLVIPPVGAQVAVTGSVNAEAIYETKPGETVATVLGYAGGPDDLAEAGRVLLYRVGDLQAATGAREIPAAQEASLPVRGGDLLQVLSEGTLQRPVARQAVVVRVEGEVNRPGNYLLPANTTLADVMARAGGTSPRAFVYGARLTRPSVQRQQQEAFNEALQQFEVSLAAAPLTDGQTLDAGERANQISAARAVLDRLRTAQPDGRVVLDVAPDARALPGGIVLENNDRLVIPPRPTTVGVFGAVYRPASFMLDEAAPSARVSDYLQRAGGPLRAADRGAIFLVRANGSVISKPAGALAARVLPGDVIFVPVKTQSASIWTRLREISTIIFQLGFSAAALATLNN